MTEDGLFQFEHSKDHRPDSLGMPVVTQVVSGEKADDPLYILAIDQVRDGVGQSGLLYVGDCKLMALTTRAHLQAGHDHYLGPFSLVQIAQTTLDEYLVSVWAGDQPLTAFGHRAGARKRSSRGHSPPGMARVWYKHAR